VTVRGGGTLASGADFLPFNVGPLAFENAANLTIEIAGAATDGVTVDGPVTLAGTIALNIAITAPAVDGLTYTLLNSAAGIAGYSGGARSPTGAIPSTKGNGSP
jgi:hypothetical protein